MYKVGNLAMYIHLKNLLSSLTDYFGREQAQFLNSLTSTQRYMNHNGVLEGLILTG